MNLVIVYNKFSLLLTKRYIVLLINEKILFFVLFKKSFFNIDTTILLICLKKTLFNKRTR